MSLLWMAVITLVILQMSVFCTTIYLHRAKTHRGLELHPVIGTLMHLQWIALLMAGEGLHNNHHEYPSSARFTLRGHEIDLAWPAIRLMEICRLAKVQQLPIAKASA